MADLKYRRIVLKLSGEALSGKQGYGIDPETIFSIAHQIKSVHELGVELCLVVGGGNIWRGLSGSAKGMDRANADHMGMLATVINAMALQDAFERVGLKARVQTAIEMIEIAEPYVRRRAIKELEDGNVVIFGAGTGNPFFSTDTAAALRAAEIEAEVILLAKKVDAVYSDDPETNPDAVKFDRLTHKEVLEKELKVMDSTAASLCMDNNIKIHVFGIADKGNVLKAIYGENIGTLVE